ncbi:MAG: hypothetical protein KIS73_08385 [Enhydrobacter sp.]|nr:hypothetical protein [Enhydrobacter sp.]
MTGTDRKDPLGYLGNKDLKGKEVLRCLAASVEQMAKSEGVEAAELARREAHALIATLEPLVAESAGVRSHLEEVVRKQPLLAIGLAAAAGFLIATLRRR